LLPPPLSHPKPLPFALHTPPFSESNLTLLSLLILRGKGSSTLR
jgi:hypothetical protein